MGGVARLAGCHFSFEARFAGGQEGRSPREVALHRRGSSRWSEKDLPNIFGSAFAWAIRFMGGLQARGG